jgi:hypothetical protein
MVTGADTGLFYSPRKRQKLEEETVDTPKMGFAAK